MAVLLTARGGGEFPTFCARQCPLLRTRAELRFMRRFSLKRRQSPARTSIVRWLSATSLCRRVCISAPPR